MEYGQAPVRCEACERLASVSPVRSDGEPPYLLCVDCARRLEARALRPREWFRLAALHGWQRPLLHDDFYDDDGKATQPEQPVEEPDQHPFPSKDEWTNSLPLAVDVAVVSWSLSAQIISKLSARPEETLELLRHLVKERRSPQIRERALEIAAIAVGPKAAGWVREQWKESPQDVLFALAQASAACLPVGSQHLWTRVSQKHSPRARVTRGTCITSSSTVQP